MVLCCSCCQWQSRSCSVSTCHTWTILSKSLILSRMNRAKPDQAPSLKLTGESWFDLWKILQAEKMNSTSASSINSDYQLTSHCLEPLRWNVNDDDIRRIAASLRGIRQSRVLIPAVCFHGFPSSCTSKRLFLFLLFLLILAAANKCSVKFSGNVVLQKKPNLPLPAKKSRHYFTEAEIKILVAPLSQASQNLCGCLPSNWHYGIILY